MPNNAELIRGLYGDFAKGDVPAVLSAFDPQISWTEASGFPYGGTYHGPEAVLTNVFMKLGSEWDGFTAAAAEFVAEGDTVVALGEYSGTYKATGKSFRAPFAHVWKLRENRIVSFHQHTDTVRVNDALA